MSCAFGEVSCHCVSQIIENSHECYGVFPYLTVYGKKEPSS
jgi:hypothetical protein